MDESKIPWTPQIVSIKQIMGNGAVVADLLATMYEQQRQHMAEYSDQHEGTHSPLSPGSYGDLTHRAVHEAARESAGYTVEEIYEAVGLLKGKPWKKTFFAPDRTELLDEVADAFHFFLEFLIILGITPEDLFRAYFRKTVTNIARREGTY